MATDVAIGDEAAASHGEARVYRKVTLRLVPFLFLCYLAACLDRLNVSFAKLQMVGALHFNDAIYGFGAAIFFVGYVLFEIPSNVLLLKVGAHIWLARIMVTWGLISAAMIFVKTPAAFYVLRFLLGVAEAGFFPGVLLYLTFWFPSAHRSRIAALFMAAVPTAGIIGGPVSGWLLKVADGAAGLQGWQWIFLIEALPSIVLGIAMLFYLDRDVANASSWLTKDERALIADAIAREAHDKTGHFRLGQAFSDGRIWLLGLIYFAIASGIYIVAFWLPTLIRQSGVIDPLEIGLLVDIPYLVTIVVMIAVATSSDRFRERRWHTFGCLVAISVGLVVAGLAGTSTVLVVAGMTLAAAGASAAMVSFWCIPSAFLGGVTAAAGFALVNSLGNVGGFASTYVVGWMTSLTHSTSSAFYLFAAVIVAVGSLVFRIPARLANR